MIPRLEDASLLGNFISDAVSLKGKTIEESSLEDYGSSSGSESKLTNLKDITNLNVLKENNYSSHHSNGNMKMDLVIYDESIRDPLYKLQQTSIPKLQQQQQQSQTNDDYMRLIEYDQNIVNQYGGPTISDENSAPIQQTSVEQQQNQLGLIGLTNLGNTCYMNSGLQCLFNNKQLIQFFLNEYLKNSSKINLANNSLTSCFISLMKKVWNRQRDYNVIKPYEFKEIMSQNYSQFQGYRQHDCQEFLTLLLGTLHDQINQGLNNRNSNNSKRHNSIQDIKAKTTTAFDLSVEKTKSNDGKMEESPLSNCSNDLMDVSSRTTSPKSSSVSTSSTYCDQLSEEETELNQTVVNPIQRIINPTSNNNLDKSPVKTISKDELKNSLRLSVKELVGKDNKLINNNLNQELDYDSKKFLKTSIDNELICSTAKQLNNQTDRSMLNDDYSDRCSFPKRMKIESDHHDSSSNNQQFVEIRNSNDKFSSESEWNKYLMKNKSIIVDTFQGQFKSTVKCSSCLNVSITYEPFMYLPVNLPNAMERQIFVTFIPSQTNYMCYSNDIKSARRYLITLNKHDKLERLCTLLKEYLIKDQMGGESTQFVFAEVEENRFVHKVIDNNTCLKYVDDKFRDVYAFEMTELIFTTIFPNSLPMLKPICLWGDSNQPATVDLVSPPSSQDQNFSLPPLSNLTNEYDLNGQNTFINRSTFINETTFNQTNINRKATFAEASLNNDEINLSNEVTNLNQINRPKLPEVFCEDWLDVLSNGDKMNQDNDIMIDENLPAGSEDFDRTATTSAFDKPIHKQFESSADSHIKTVSTDELITVVDNNFDTCNILPIQLSCAICLEEKDSSQLLIHPACSCQLCPQCLDMTVKHYSENENNFLCPTCSQYIDKTDFVPFGSKRPVQNLFTTNYYLIPILFRIQEKHNYSNFKLVIRPILLRLPNLVSGRELYEVIDRFVPAPIPYSLCFVNKSGQKCNRCEWGGNCNGCEITRIGDVLIHPSDSIAVEFEHSYSHELDSLMPDSLKQILDHPSVHQYKKPEKLTLHECLKSFNQSEMLDDDNPWFCEKCNSNQKARKSLTIWKLADTLIVYLKRFVFHNMNSIKIDEPVEYPIEKFDISPYYQVDNKNKEEPNDGLIYDLKSIICHSGGVNSGHYTAFSKSAWNNKWFYFNDESVVELEPNSSDERAYILFYSRKTTNNLTNLDFLSSDEIKK